MTKKTKVILASIGVISLFLLTPFAQAAIPQVWFDTSTELIWKCTEETLNESLEVTDTTVFYFKHNFTEITPGADSLKVRGPYLTATNEDVTTYGYDNASIWDGGGLSINVDILDNDLMTKFIILFNELSTNITEINTLPTNNQTYVLLKMGIMLDSAFFTATFTYMLGKQVGSTFGRNINSSTIIRNSSRNIEYDIFLDFSIDDSGHWNNMTYNGNLNLTYGETSNVLMRSVIFSNLTTSEWNGTVYESEDIIQRSTYEIVAPEVLLDDFPVIPSDPEPDPKPKIPGFSIPLLMGAIVLSVVLVYKVMKRKKK